MGRKKELRRTLPSTREAPRAVSARATSDSPAAYPTAAELAKTPEWREFLGRALRDILRPAAVAGAIGLAASGCAATLPGKPTPVMTTPGMTPVMTTPASTTQTTQTPAPCPVPPSPNPDPPQIEGGLAAVSPVRLPWA